MDKLFGAIGLIPSRDQYCEAPGHVGYGLTVVNMSNYAERYRNLESPGRIGQAANPLEAPPWPASNQYHEASDHVNRSLPSIGDWMAIRLPPLQLDMNGLPLKRGPKNPPMHPPFPPPEPPIPKFPLDPSFFLPKKRRRFAMGEENDYARSAQYRRRIQQSIATVPQVVPENNPDTERLWRLANLAESYFQHQNR